MKTLNPKSTVVALLAVIAMASSSLVAAQQEHPKGAEHPKAAAGAEHPSGAEHPATQAARPATTIADVAAAVRKYVDHDTASKGGYFLVYDTETKEPLALTLDKIHDDRLTPMGNGVHFVCADFKATNGHTYDVDFFTKDTAKGLELTDVVTVHKVDGKARYQWQQQGDTWVRAK